MALKKTNKLSSIGYQSVYINSSNINEDGTVRLESDSVYLWMTMTRIEVRGSRRMQRSLPRFAVKVKLL